MQKRSHPQVIPHDSITKVSVDCLRSVDVYEMFKLVW